MSLAFKRIKVYSRLTLLCAVALVIGLVVIKNRSHEVKFWFFRTYENVNVLWLLLCTAAGSIITFWVFRAVFSLWRDVREVSRESAIRAERERQEKKAKELTEQEKRVDEKRAELLRDES